MANQVIEFSQGWRSITPVLAREVSDQTRHGNRRPIGLLQFRPFDAIEILKHIGLIPPGPYDVLELLKHSLNSAVGRSRSAWTRIASPDSTRTPPPLSCLSEPLRPYMEWPLVHIHKDAPIIFPG